MGEWLSGMLNEAMMLGAAIFAGGAFWRTQRSTPKKEAPLDASFLQTLRLSLALPRAQWTLPLETYHAGQRVQIHPLHHPGGRLLSLTLSLPASLHALTLHARHDDVPAQGADFTGDARFDALFVAHPHSTHTLRSLGREARAELTSLMTPRPGVYWEDLHIQAGTLNGLLRVDTSSMPATKISTMIKALARCASALHDTQHSSAFTRLVSEASKPQSPGYRTRCLLHLMEHHADQLVTLRAHPDAGLRFACLSAHPELFGRTQREELLRTTALKHPSHLLRARARALSEPDLDQTDLPLSLALHALLPALEKLPARAALERACALITEAMPRERALILHRLGAWPQLDALLEHHARCEDFGPVDVEAIMGLGLDPGACARWVHTFLGSEVASIAMACARHMAEHGGASDLATLRRARQEHPGAPWRARALDVAIQALEARLARPDERERR